MTNLDSTHFSDKISYKILFISNYQSKDMNYASFQKNRKGLRTFLTQMELARELTAGPGVADRVVDCCAGARLGLTDGARLSYRKKE
jgi:hypothetical protein